MTSPMLTHVFQPAPFYTSTLWNSIQKNNLLGRTSFVQYILWPLVGGLSDLKGTGQSKNAGTPRLLPFAFTPFKVWDFDCKEDGQGRDLGEPSTQNISQAHPFGLAQLETTQTFSDRESDTVKHRANILLGPIKFGFLTLALTYSFSMVALDTITIGKL